MWNGFTNPLDGIGAENIRRDAEVFWDELGMQGERNIIMAAVDQLFAERETVSMTDSWDVVQADYDDEGGPGIGERVEGKEVHTSAP